MSEISRELTELIEGLAKDAAATPDGQLSAQWPQIRELGLAAIGIDEEAGGAGGGPDDLMVVIRELARAGIATPIVESSTAAFAIGIAPQDTFDTVVVNRDVELESPELTADLGLVPFAALAGRLVIVGHSGLAAVGLDQPGVTVDATVDIAGLPAGNVRLNRVSPQQLSPQRSATAVTERLALARASALLGCAQGAYALTRDYVTQRQQFGASLNKIPAVSAGLAQMSVRIAHARAAVDRATTIVADPQAPPLRRFGAVASSRITAARTATLVARTAHQLHGAVGVTREYGLYRYTRSLWAWRDADESERTLATRLGARVRNGDESTLWEDISA